MQKQNLHLFVSIFSATLLTTALKFGCQVVSGDTTINHVLQILSASGLIPLKTENHYISTSRARRLGGYETMASFGAGNLTHLYLRSSFFGGSGVFFLLSSIHFIYS